MLLGRTAADPGDQGGSGPFVTSEGFNNANENFRNLAETYRFFDVPILFSFLLELKE